MPRWRENFSLRTKVRPAPKDKFSATGASHAPGLFNVSDPIPRSLIISKYCNRIPPTTSPWLFWPLARNFNRAKTPGRSRRRKSCTTIRLKFRASGQKSHGDVVGGILLQYFDIIKDLGIGSDT